MHSDTPNEHDRSEHIIVWGGVLFLILIIAGIMWL
jgi:hypothetical protein